MFLVLPIAVLWGLRFPRGMVVSVCIWLQWSKTTFSTAGDGSRGRRAGDCFYVIWRQRRVRSRLLLVVVGGCRKPCTSCQLSSGRATDTTLAARENNVSSTARFLFLFITSRVEHDNYALHQRVCYAKLLPLSCSTHRIRKPIGGGTVALVGGSRRGFGGRRRCEGRHIRRSSSCLDFPIPFRTGSVILHNIARYYLQPRLPTWRHD